MPDPHDDVRLQAQVDGEFSPTVSTPSASTDPAAVAAECMLRRSLIASGIPFPATSPALAILVTPSDVWNELVRDAWRVVVERDVEADESRTAHRWRSHPSSVAYVGREHQMGPERFDEEEMEKALYLGQTVIGISARPDVVLPKDLLRHAEVRLVLNRPTSADVAEVAAGLAGGVPCTPFELAETPTPKNLRLARRVGQTGDDYVRRLIKLLEIEALEAAERQVPVRPPADPRSEPTLDRLHGMEEAVRWGMALARDLKSVQAGELEWNAVDRGCLLSGPPGCGKTLFARALSTTCGIPLVSGSYSRWLGTGNAHQGSLLKAMNQTFAAARAKAPVILFIDEVDSFPDRSKTSHRYAEWDIQVVNALLAEIDGVEGREGVILLAACNQPDKLDPALVRSGRLDRHIMIHLPDRRALAGILREHLGPDLVDDDLAHAALLALGSTGADCERIVRGARRTARSHNRPMIPADLETEIMGTNRRDGAELQMVCIHEAGHAVAAQHYKPGSVNSLSARQSDYSGGVMSLNGGSGYIKARDIHAHLVILLSGRAAEQVMLGAPSSAAGGGPTSDIARATKLVAVSMDMLGFSDELGMAWRGSVDERTLSKAMSQRRIRSSVSRVLAEIYEEALALASANRRGIAALAAVLAARTVLDGPTIIQVLDDAREAGR